VQTVDVRGFVVAGCLLVLGCAAGCAPAPSNVEVIEGLLVRVSSNVPLSKPAFVPMAGDVRVVEGSKRVALASVDVSGRFSVQVPPGRYVLEATGTRPGFVCSTARVDAVANAHVSVTVACEAPLGAGVGALLPGVPPTG
jgi:hypothetical protein